MTTAFFSFCCEGFICEAHNNPADFFMDVIFDYEAAHRHGLSDSSGTLSQYLKTSL